MKHLLMIDGRVAIVPSADNEKQIMHLKESAMLTPNCWIFPIAVSNNLSMANLTELASVTEHGRVRFSTCADDYEFFRSFFDCIDIVLGANRETHETNI